MRRITTVLAILGLGLVWCVWCGSSYAGITDTDLESNFGFRVALMYAHNNLSAADGGVANIPIAGTRDVSAGSQANSEYIMPFAGKIIGIGAISNAALTAGNAHFQVTVNGSVADSSVGTALRADPGLTTTNGTRNYNNLVDRFTKSTSYTFSAGDRIGVSMTSAPGIAPTTADIVVTVIVDQNAQE